MKPTYKKQQAPIPASAAPWVQSPEFYLAGRAATDGMDDLAVLTGSRRATQTNLFQHRAEHPHINAA